MGLDLGNRTTGKGDLEEIAAIAGGHDPGAACSRQQLFRRCHRFKTGIGLAAALHRTRGIDDHQFGGP